jgi:hypothetical protein
MMLTPEQRAELDSHSPSSIQFKLLQAGPGRGASVSGFKCGEITRGDIEDWLVDQNVLQRSRIETSSSTRNGRFTSPPPP